MIQNPEQFDSRNGNSKKILSAGAGGGGEHRGLGCARAPQEKVMGVFKTLKDVDPGPERLDKAATNCM